MNYILAHILLLLLVILLVILYTIKPNKQTDTFDVIETNKAIINLELYPELKILEENKNIVIEELNKVIDKDVWILYESLHKDKIISKNYNNEEINKLDNSINKYYLNSLKKPEWFVFGLLYNKNSTLNSKKYFPKTVKILESIKNITITNAGISCLEAGGYIPPHNDEGIERYKYHLPLIIPEKCGIKINEINYNFDKPFLFDDTYIHSVWNKSDKPRFVLIVDVLRK